MPAKDAESSTEASNSITPVTADIEIHDIDTQYTLLTPFDSWSTIILSDQVWTRYVQRFQKAAEDSTSEARERIVNSAVRAAAFDSGAIEGLYVTDRGITHTVAVQSAVLDATLEVAGPDARAHLEAQLLGYEMVLDLATRAGEVSESWIRQLQETVCKPQATYVVQTAVGARKQSLTLGNYKEHPNHVRTADGGNHAYCPVAETREEMARLVEQLRSPAFVAAHPVLQAAYAHYGLTHIHPFPDGNGRTARAMASVFTYRGASVPLVVYADQRQQYFAGLNSGDAGNPAIFVNFIFDRVIDTLALVTDELARFTIAPAPSRLARLTVTHGGLPLEEIAVTAARIQDRLRIAMEAAFVEQGLPDQFNSETIVFGGKLDCTYWGLPYHSPPEGGHFRMLIRTSAPSALEQQCNPFVGIADNLDEIFTFVVVDATRSTFPVLELRLADTYPTLTAAAEQRIINWGSRLVGLVLKELEGVMIQALRNAGLDVGDG